MVNIICSTNRADAVSKHIADIYKQLLNDNGQEAEVINLQGLPHDFAFSALYSNSGKNEKFNVYREKMVNAEKFVFVVPEYNGSFPGVLKTFIDGLIYPKTFTGKKCALVGLSSGIQGAGLALSHLTDIFNYCGMHVLARKVKMAQIEKAMDNDVLSDEKYIEQLNKQSREFLAF